MLAPDAGLPCFPRRAGLFRPAHGLPKARKPPLSAPPPLLTTRRGGRASMPAEGKISELASTSIYQPKLVCERTEIMRRYHAMRERRVCAPPGLRVERAPSLPAERRACRSCCHFGGEKLTRQEQITCTVVELSQDIGAYRTSLELYPRHVEFPQDWTRGGWGFPVEHIDVRRRSRSHSK